MNKNKIILIIIALFAITTTDAFSQIQGRFRAGADIGGWPNIGNMPRGAMGNINLGYNIRDNMTIGISSGFANFNHQRYNNVYSSFESINFMGTYTYFFGSGSIMPFIGGGLGLHLMDTRANYWDWNNELSGWGEINSNQIGGFLTTGIEFGRFRIAAQYNLLPTSNFSFELSDPWGQQHHGMVNVRARNSYFALTAGFYIGGGSRRVVRLEREREELRRELEALMRERELGIPVHAVEAEAPIQQREVRPIDVANSFNTFANQHIEIHLSQWQQRGEFERLADWEQRVSENNRQTRALELRQEAAQMFIEERSHNFLVGATLGAYDPDNETFLLQTNLHGTLLMPVSIDEGLNFRNNWNSHQRIPHFVIHNDRLAFSGVTFVATDGTTSRYNFSTPVEINISEQNIAVLQSQRTMNIVAQPTPSVPQNVPVNEPVSIREIVETPPPPPVIQVVPEREVVQIAEPAPQVVTPGIIAAHDVITLRNGNLINAHVAEITLTEIRYRAAENPLGPIITLAQRDVFSIDFANGTRQIISAPAEQGRQGRQGVSAHQGSFQQGDFAVGGRLTIYPASGLPTFGIGAKVRYNITNPIRLEGGFTYFLPLTARVGDLRESVSLWSFSANMHYLFPVAENITLYPLLGFSVVGGAERISYGSQSARFPIETTFLFNLGGGIDIKLNNHISVNVEPKLWFNIVSGVILVDFLPSVGVMYRF